MRTLGIVPARGGSKRLPRKNVLPLGGKPLVCWAIEAALASLRLSRVIVTSDDDEVLAIATRYGSVLALRRPPELATDTSPAIDYVRHALAAVEATDDRYDSIAIVQPTSPFTQSGDIDSTLDLLERSGADSAVTVMQVDHAIHPVKLKVMHGDRLLPYLEEEGGRMAAHELPKVFVRNCSVYTSRRHVVDDGQIIGPDCRGHVMPAARSLDINEELDLLFAEFLLQGGRRVP